MMLEESTGNFSASRTVYDWYQTGSHVILNIMIKNLKETDVKVKLIDETLDVSCNLADGSTFRLHFNLFKPIYVQDSNWSVTPSKLEIKLKKTDRKRWQSLEQIPEKINKRNSQTLNVSNSSLQRAQVTVTACQQQSPPPKPKHDWYQSDTHVIIVVHIRNLNTEGVKVEFTENHLYAECLCEDESLYKLSLALFKQINPAESDYSISTSKLEIRMRKANKGRWSNLEAMPMVVKNCPETPVFIVTHLPTTTVEVVDDTATIPVEVIPDGANFETVESTVESAVDTEKAIDKTESNAK